MREVRRRWRAASTRARCVSHASLSSFSRKKTYARKTTMPRRPRTRGRIFDARARLCAAKIHAPNINQRCPTPWIQLTCLVGTVTVCRATKDDKKHPSRATLDARRFFFASARSLFFAYDPTPDGKDDIHVPRVPSRAPDRPRCDSCCRPRLSVSVRCVFLRAFIITSLPATVLGRRAIGRDPLCPSVALRTSLLSRSSKPIPARRDDGEAPRVLLHAHVRDVNVFPDGARLFFYVFSDAKRRRRIGGFRVFSVDAARRLRRRLGDETSGLGRAV